MYCNIWASIFLRVKNFPEYLDYITAIYFKYLTGREEFVKPALKTFIW